MSKIKRFVKKWIFNNIGYKIIAIIFAFVLWLVILNINDPTISRTIANIPVIILNEEKVLDGSRVYTVESGETATISISGNRSIVSPLSANDFTAKADFRELSITNAVPISVELTGDKARYAGSVIITLRTNSMVINLEDMDEKNMNVEVEFTGTEHENLVIEDASALPAMASLRAPVSVIKAAQRVVAYLNYNDVAGDTVIESPLVVLNASGDVIEQDENISLSIDSASIQVKTSIVKEVPVIIEPEGKPAEGTKCTGITYSKNKIKIKGSSELINNVGSILLPSELLSLEGQDKDVSVSVKLSEYLPQGINIYGDNDLVTITATIEKDEKEAQTEEETETP